MTGTEPGSDPTTRPRPIPATEAARRFLDLVERVRSGRESFLVIHEGEAVCRIEPVEPRRRRTFGDLLDFLEGASGGGPGFADDLERVQDEQPGPPRSPWDLP